MYLHLCVGVLYRTCCFGPPDATLRASGFHQAQCHTQCSTCTPVQVGKTWKNMEKHGKIQQAERKSMEHELHRRRLKGLLSWPPGGQASRERSSSREFKVNLTPKNWWSWCHTNIGVCRLQASEIQCIVWTLFNSVFSEVKHKGKTQPALTNASQRTHILHISSFYILPGWFISLTWRGRRQILTPDLTEKVTRFLTLTDPQEWGPRSPSATGSKNLLAKRLSSDPVANEFGTPNSQASKIRDTRGKWNPKIMMCEAGPRSLSTHGAPRVILQGKA